jgi:hypothetical protein
MTVNAGCEAGTRRGADDVLDAAAAASPPAGSTRNDYSASYTQG